MITSSLRGSPSAENSREKGPPNNLDPQLGPRSADAPPPRSGDRYQHRPTCQVFGGPCNVGT
jgi:hypothetical protein